MPYGPFLIRHPNIVHGASVSFGKKLTATILPPHV